MLADGGPETMVSTEVWLPAGFSLEYWLRGHHIVSGGPLGSSGRYVALTILLLVVLSCLSVLWSEVTAKPL